MKVVFFASTDDQLGGAKSLIEMVTLLKEKGICVIVINLYKNKLNVQLDQIGIQNISGGYHLNICRHDCAGAKWIVKYVIKYLRYKLFQERAKRLISKHICFDDVDVIHSNNSVEDIGAYFAKKYKIPHVWHLREFGDLDFGFEYFHKRIGRYISDNADIAIAISEAVKREWVKKGLSEDKVIVITHGINTNRIKEHKKIDSSCINLVFAGAIVPEKGQLSFVKAISKLEESEKKQIHLDLYGTSDENNKRNLLYEIENNNLSSIVSYKGYTDRLYDLLGNYHVGIVNSKCEAMGRVTIEYMTSGLFVLATNSGANPELIDSSSYGYLYDREDENSIVNALRHVIINKDSILRGEFSGRQKALERYDINKNVDKYIQIYRSLLNGSKE